MRSRILLPAAGRTCRLWIVPAARRHRRRVERRQRCRERGRSRREASCEWGVSTPRIQRRSRTRLYVPNDLVPSCPPRRHIGILTVPPFPCRGHVTVTTSSIRLAAGQFLGDITRSLDAADVLLRETRHAGGQVIPPHTHETPHFCLGVAGACVERIDERD